MPISSSWWAASTSSNSNRLAELSRRPWRSRLSDGRCFGLADAVVLWAHSWHHGAPALEVLVAVWWVRIRENGVIRCATWTRRNPWSSAFACKGSGSTTRHPPALRSCSADRSEGFTARRVCHLVRARDREMSFPADGCSVTMALGAAQWLTEVTPRRAKTVC